MSIIYGTWHWSHIKLVDVFSVVCFHVLSQRVVFCSAIGTLFIACVIFLESCSRFWEFRSSLSAAQKETVTLTEKRCTFTGATGTASLEQVRTKGSTTLREIKDLNPLIPRYVQYRNYFVLNENSAHGKKRILCVFSPPDVEISFLNRFRFGGQTCTHQLVRVNKWFLISATQECVAIAIFWCWIVLRRVFRCKQENVGWNHVQSLKI